MKQLLYYYTDNTFIASYDDMPDVVMRGAVKANSCADSSLGGHEKKAWNC